MGMGVSTNSGQDVIMMLLSLCVASIAEGCMDFKDCENFQRRWGGPIIANRELQEMTNSNLAFSRASRRSVLWINSEFQGRVDLRMVTRIPSLFGMQLGYC